MNVGTPLLLATLLAQGAMPVAPEEPVDHDGAYGWQCLAVVAIGRHRGTVTRNYGRDLAHSPYQMQTGPPDRDSPYTMGWAIDPRPEGPPEGKKRRWPFPVREADAFRNGPASVLIEIEGVPPAHVGPIWIHYWGDGAYFGGRMAMKARKVRRFFGKDRQMRFAAAPDAALKAKLASAGIWTVVAVDGTGSRFASETFEAATPREAEAAFRQARARIDSLESRFAADHRPLDEGDAGCTDHENPASTI